MDEENTFNKLRRIPLAEIREKVRNMHESELGYNGTFYEQMLKDPGVFYFDLIKMMYEHGWTMEEYVKEIKKDQLRIAITRINNDSYTNAFFDEIKVYFPNMVFHPARIDLGE
jgi:hypothetical protein